MKRSPAKQSPQREQRRTKWPAEKQRELELRAVDRISREEVPRQPPN
jgi:hypothetical protein